MTGERLSQKFFNCACPAYVGERVAFVPDAFVRYEAKEGVPVTLRGRVIHVNEAHRHYTVEAECNGATLRESFKF